MRRVRLILMISALVLVGALIGFVLSDQSPTTLGLRPPATAHTEGGRENPDAAGSNPLGSRSPNERSTGEKSTREEPAGEGSPGGDAGEEPTDEGSPGGDTQDGAQWPTVFNAWIGGEHRPDCELLWNFQTPRSPYLGDGSPGHTTLTLGEDRQICLAGFDIHSEIELTVERPDRSRQAVTVAAGTDALAGPSDILTPPDLANFFILADHEDYLATNFGQLDPSMPSGTYTIMAEQGELSTRTTIELLHGPLGDPDLSYLKPQDTYDYSQAVRAGDQLTALLLRFSPHATVPLAIYRNTGTFREGTNEYILEYVSELPAARVNEQGWTYYKISVPASLPAAGHGHGYCIVTAPNLMVPFCQPGIGFTFKLAD